MANNAAKLRSKYPIEGAVLILLLLELVGGPLTGNMVIGAKFNVITVLRVLSILLVFFGYCVNARSLNVPFLSFNGVLIAGVTAWTLIAVPASLISPEWANKHLLPTTNEPMPGWLTLFIICAMVPLIAYLCLLEFLVWVLYTTGGARREPPVNPV